eukprot:TRINITY_DN8549_c0_g1_i1.p1 TRINITY_DN8549_c0_g1~~TRINITY_DN8549_c0_g1_i1.p1  ORF type:complete len:727 (+),score=102.41 TRINITY_DN8549_c0_g1_i1:42-2222(+)
MAATAAGATVGSAWGADKKLWEYLGLVGLLKADSEPELRQYAQCENATLRLPTLTEDLADEIIACGEALYSSFPAVRNQVLRLALQSNLSDTTLTRIVAVGLRDPWSATRKQTAALLNKDFLKRKSSKLFSIAESLTSDGRWETVDGALLLVKKMCGSLFVVFQPTPQRSLTKGLTMCETVARRLLSLRHAKKSIRSNDVIMSSELLCLTVKLLSHSQDSIRESASNIVISLLSSCTLYFPQIRLYETVLSEATKSSLGALSAINSSVQMMPMLCVKETFYLMLTLFQSMESLVRHRAADTACKCVILREPLLDELVAIISADGSDCWQVQEANMIVVEEVLLKEVKMSLSIIEKLAYWIIDMRTAYFKEGKQMPFETARMRSQLIPHIARTYLSILGNTPSKKKRDLLSVNGGDFEWLFWILWSSKVKDVNCSLDIESSDIHVDPCSHQCQDTFWSLSVHLSLLGIHKSDNKEHQQRLFNDVKTLVASSQHHPQLEHVFVRLLPDVIPFVVRECHSSVVDILLLLLKQYSQTNAQVNILLALRRVAEMSVAAVDDTVHFDSCVVLNITCLTESYEKCWGTVQRPAISTKVIGVDASKNQSCKRILDQCCELLATKGSSQSAMGMAVKAAVVLVPDTAGHQQLLFGLARCMEGEGIVINPDTLDIQSSQVPSTTHDWDLDSESDDDAQQTTMIAKWMPDIKLVDFSNISTQSEYFNLVRWITNYQQ